MEVWKGCLTNEQTENFKRHACLRFSLLLTVNAMGLAASSSGLDVPTMMDFNLEFHAE